MGEKRNFAALEWVIGEISDTLTEARQSLEAYVEDPKDSTRIRFCLTHIHQVHGSLQMVEFHGAALLAEEMEQTAQAIMDNQVSSVPEAQEVLMRSLLQLPILLDHIKSTKEDNPVRVMPLLNDLRAVRKQSYLSETNLFSPDLSSLEHPSGVRHEVLSNPEKLAQVLKKLREMYQFAAASVLRSIKVDENLNYLDKVFSRLELITAGTPSYPIWEVSAALAQALHRDEVELTVAVRGLLRYIARELRILGDDPQVAVQKAPRESLLKNLLYYVARAEDGSEKVAAVKEKYGLRSALLHADETSSGNQDILQAPDASAIRSVVVALQDEIGSIKHVLDVTLSGQGSTEEIKEVLPVVKRVADTLAVLGIGDLRKQMLTQSEHLEKISEANSIDEQELMQAASGIIEIEHRLQAIAKSAGKHSDLGSVNEREVEIDNAKAAVIKECASGLQKSKDAVIDYISSQWDKSHLEGIGALLTDIRGGLNMIPLPRPAAIVDSCAAYIQENLLESDQHPSFQALESLADAMSSVEYYLERLMEDLNESSDSTLDIAEESVANLGYQIVSVESPAAEEAEHTPAPSVAEPSNWQQAAVDEEESLDNEDEVLSGEFGLQTEVQSESDTSSEEESTELATVDDEPQHLSPAFEMPEQRAEPEAPMVLSDDTPEDDAHDEIEMFDSRETQSEEDAFAERDAETVAAAQPAPAPSIPLKEPEESESDIDDEIIEIFIEEAGEVLETLQEYYPQWRDKESDQDALVVVRRAFHTLKGSGRMVEAFDIGELAWSVENMLNRVIDRTIRVEPPVYHLIDAVIEVIPTLVDAFEKRQANPIKALTSQYETWGHEISEGKYPEALSSPLPAFEGVEAQADADETLEDAAESPTQTAAEIEQTPSVAEADADLVTFDSDDDDDGVDRVLQEIFSQESSSHLETLDAFVGEMEREAPIYAPPTDALQRALHTLKGSAKMAQVWPIAEIAEPLEHFTKELISFQVPVDNDILQLLRDASDYTRQAIEQIDADDTVVIPKKEQFVARTRELRNLAVGHFDSMRGGDSGQHKVDPRLLSLVMAEEMGLLLQADTLLRRCQDDPQKCDSDLRALVAELAALEEGANNANLMDMSQLSAQLRSAHEMTLDGRLNADEHYYQTMHKGHEALLDMVDAVAAGQNVVSPGAELITSIQTMLDSASASAAEAEEAAAEESTVAEFSTDQSFDLDSGADERAGESAGESVGESVEESAENALEVSEELGAEATEEFSAEVPSELPDEDSGEAAFLPEDTSDKVASFSEELQDTGAEGETAFTDEEEITFDFTPSEDEEEISFEALPEDGEIAFEAEDLADEEAEITFEETLSDDAEESELPLISLEDDDSDVVLEELIADSSDAIESESDDKETDTPFSDSVQSAMDVAASEPADQLDSEQGEAPAEEAEFSAQDDQESVLESDAETIAFEGLGQFETFDDEDERDDSLVALSDQTSHAPADSSTSRDQQFGSDISPEDDGLISFEEAISFEVNDDAPSDEDERLVGESFAEEGSEADEFAAFSAELEDFNIDSLNSAESEEDEAASFESALESESEDASAGFGIEDVSFDADEDDTELDEFDELDLVSVSEAADATSDAVDDTAPAFDVAAEMAAADDPNRRVIRLPGLIDRIDTRSPDFDADILEVFLEEADELVEGLDEAIHGWESDWSDPAHLEEIKRILHTLKGGARLSGLNNLGDLTHDYETMLIEMGDDLSGVDRGFFSTIHGYQDKILGTVRGVRTFLAGDFDVAEIGESIEDAAEAKREQAIVKKEEDKKAEALKEESDASNVFQFQPKPRSPSGAEPPEFVMPTISSGSGASAGVALKKAGPQEVVKVSSELLEELVNLAGETSINRSRLEQYVNDFGHALDEVDVTLNRLKDQLRRLDIETEAQILFRQEQMEAHDEFDPLEMDRYSHLQQLSRSLIESASDLTDLKSDLNDKLKVTETLLIQQSRINTTLQEGLMRSRMVPFSRMVPRLRRIVRQVASELGKNVSFELDNVEGELDRSVLERMVPPFEHMLRNAVDHGIESPEDRIESGKSEAGRIVLTLAREGGDVIIRLADDGRGINLKRVREKAIERELMSADAELSDHDIMQFILHAGFSTAETVSQISGRGVGMDVVNAEIKQLGGSVTINSAWGKGTEFVVRLPFTLSVNRALMVAIGTDQYAVPLSSIEGIVRVSPFELEHYYANPEAQFEYANENYQVRYLGSLLARGAQANLEGQVLPMPVLLVRSAEHTMALQVDAVMGSREIVVKSLGQQFSTVAGLSGATVMGDGSVVVILDPHALVRQEIAQASLQLGGDKVELITNEAEDDRIRQIMVVDDSVTVRKVTTRFLEREGFEVITAKDGVDALRLLQEGVPDLMLLDIEMPRMDGFEVAKTVRSTQRWEDLPIIMITSRTGDKHREHALSLGVNNYLGKPYQEDILMEAIGEILDVKAKRN